MQQQVEWRHEECANFLSFIGYGNPKGKVWFLGLEEGLGGKMLTDEARANLHARAKWAPIMDMREAHLTLTEKGKPIDISKPRVGSITVWLWMAKIMRALRGDNDCMDLDKAKQYVRDDLGREGKQTFLSELSPVPKKGVSEKTWLREITSISNAKECLDQRRAKQRQLLASHGPVVICYGLGRKFSAANEYAELLGIKWESIGEELWRAPDANYFLLPFFGVGQMSEECLQRFIDHQAFQVLRSL